MTAATSEVRGGIGSEPGERRGPLWPDYYPDWIHLTDQREQSAFKPAVGVDILWTPFGNYITADEKEMSPFQAAELSPVLQIYCY